MAGDTPTKEVTLHHSNGQISEIYRVLDGPGPEVRHGLTTSWYTTGALHRRWRFDHGKLEGAQETWYENGQLWTVRHYRAGVQEGSFTMWHANGTKGVETIYRNDAPMGSYNAWYDDGSLQFERTYDDQGNLTGQCRTWNEHGVLVHDGVY